MTQFNQAADCEKSTKIMSANNLFVPDTPGPDRSSVHNISVWLAIAKGAKRWANAQALKRDGLAASGR